MTETLCRCQPRSEPAVTRMLVADVIRRFRPAYHRTWPNAVAALTSDPADAETISLLTAELAAAGRFSRPVIVDDESRRIQNGMHRVVAALVVGLSEIDVADAYPVQPLDVLYMTFTLDSDAVDDEAMFECVVDWLRSFPLSAHWVNCDTFACVGGEYSGHFYCPAEHATELAQTVVERAARVGLRLGITSLGPPEEDVEPCLTCGGARAPR